MAYHFLLSLFSTPQEADAIVGDLIEEDASHRQYVRAIADLAWAPFRESPFTMIGLGIVYMAAVWPLTWVTARSAQILVTNVEVYSYIPASLFWQLISLKPFIVVALGIAFLTGRRAMSVAIAMFLAMAFVVCVIDPVAMLFLGPARPQQLSLLFWISRAAYALVVWGGLVLISTAVGITFRRKLRAA